jgi:hypothetical protein
MKEARVLCFEPKDVLKTGSVKDGTLTVPKA